MTVISVEEFRAHPDQYLAETARGDVVLTRDGEPWIVLRGVD
jgi:prevent-host-death family protein